MAISEADIKLLWGRAAAMCSRPGCNRDLTRIIKGGKNYNVGEMAHVIAQSASGPRGNGAGGSNDYDNLILLCPTCHRDVDKAPEGEFPAETLHDWKSQHEEKIRCLGSEIKFTTFAELKQAVSFILNENYQTWKTLGPKSEVAERSPASNAHHLWDLRRIDKIIPNNRRIMNMVRANSHLLNTNQSKSFAEFANHAENYEIHIYERTEGYPLFPDSFRKEFE